MLYVFCGDIVKAKKKARELAKVLLTKKPDASLFELTPDSWNEAAFQEYLGGQGLFEKKYIVLMHELASHKQTKDFFLDNLKELKASENVFVLVEGELTKKDQAPLEKNAEKLQSFDVSEKINKKEFNIFALTDAIGRRDAIAAWTIFTQAQMAGMEAEQIHGMIAWQLKAMALAQVSKDAKSSGLNPFVFTKAVAAAKKYSQEEVVSLYNKLIRDYHNSRRGMIDFSLATEQFLLSL
ncbi:MAG: hypothetical protein HZA80_00865 [Candidatus Taylorbacteria bacterium]|nr:hypothetical protein [Candidatus Taylorbacteria bacterium]